MELRRFTKRLTEVYVYPEICKYQDTIEDVEKYMAFLDSKPIDSGFMIYVHIPFCEALCFFCNYFKTVIRKDAYQERKLLFDAYVQEIENYARRPYLSGRPVRAVQFGGGTPSAVEPEFVVQILDAIRANFDCQFEMITMEGNVTSLKEPAKLRIYKDAGIQRISFGVQTFNEQIRKRLHLKATVDDVFEAVESIRHVGFEDYSHDLMFNLPDQRLDDVYRDMEIMDHRIRPTYLDYYNLNVMPNTTFSRALHQELYCKEAPSDEKQILMMREISRLAKEMGYRQLMSNIFSKTRKKCVLTLGMELNGSESIGIGPSARGFVCRHGYRNIPSVEDYVARVKQHDFSAIAGNVSTREECNERKLVMMGNFMFIDTSEIEGIERFKPQIDFLVQEGYAKLDGSILKLTEEGKLWPGNISEIFFNSNQRARRTRAMLQAIRNKENPYNQDRMGISASFYRKPRQRPVSPSSEARSKCGRRVETDDSGHRSPVQEVRFPKPIPPAFKENLERQIYYFSEDIEGFELILSERGIEGVRICIDKEAVPETVSAKVLAATKGYSNRQAHREPERIWSSGFDHPASSETFENMCRRGVAYQVAGGLVAVGERFMALTDYVDQRIMEIVKRDFDAVEYRYPTLIASQVMRRGGYIKSFPQLMMFVTRLHSDYNVLSEAMRADSSSGYLRHCCETDLCLPPTMCYHTYSQFSDSVLQANPGCTITSRGKSFRFESKYEKNLERLWDFTIREIVWLGTASFVSDQRRRLMSTVFQLMEQWGLAGHCETATDPFFLEDGGQDSGFVQRLMALKYELRLGIDWGDTLAAASFNLHNDFFGNAFGIHFADGKTIHTACAGFGLERLAFAFLCQHGFEEESWPEDVRTAAAGGGDLA